MSIGPRENGTALDELLASVGPELRGFAEVVAHLAPEHTDRPEVLNAIRRIVMTVDDQVRQGETPNELLTNPQSLITRFEQPNWTPNTAFNIGSVIIPAADTARADPSQGHSGGPRHGPLRSNVARLLLSNLDELDNELGWTPSRVSAVRVSAVDSDSTGSRRPRMRPNRLIGKRIGSLSRVVARSRAPIIALQGVPGSGKSVALRAYARGILEKAADASGRDTQLAIYISLREFSLEPELVTAASLRAYISRVSNLGQSRVLTEYFARQFDDDIENGRLILLLDAFDEIPSVAGATSANTATVVPYQRAIAALMEGSTAKCVVASREYRGPRTQAWPRYLLVGLSPDEQVALLRAHGVDDYLLEVVGTLLREPRQGFTTDVRTPLTLKLLAEYLISTRRAPERPSQIFAHFVTSQFDRVGLAEGEVARMSRALSQLAFELTRSPNSLYRDIVRQICDSSRTGESDGLVGTLELAHASKLLMRVTTRDEVRLAFTHRRVQEYFATQFVLENPGEVSPRTLAEDGNWRETAVAMLQELPPSDSADLIGEILGLITERDVETESAAPLDAWTSRDFHLFELLVAAFYANPTRMPDRLRFQVATRLSDAWIDGSIGDRKFTLDCLPLADGSSQVGFVQDAFAGRSLWLRTVALREGARLHHISLELQRCIARLLVTLLAHRRLSHDAKAVDAELRQLDVEAETYLLRVRRTLVWIPLIAFVICGARIMQYMILSGRDLTDPAAYRFEIVYSLIVPIMIFWTYIASEPISYGIEKGRLRLLAERILKYYNWRLPNDSETIQIGTALVGSLLGLVWVIAGAIEIAMNWKDPGHGILLALSTAVLSFYAFAWGPSAVAVLVDSRSRRVSFARQLVLAPLSFLIGLIRGNMRLYGRYLARALLQMLIFMAPIYLIVWLVVRFGGAVGRVILTVVGVVGISVVPLLIVFAIVRLVRSKRRVRRAIRDAGVPSSLVFLRAFLSLKDVAERIDFVRENRIAQSAGDVTIERRPVQELAWLLSKGDSEVSRETFEGARYCPEIRELVETGELTSGSLLDADAELLDELARLEEVLRTGRD